jgi:hypothetical protein
VNQTTNSTREQLNNLIEFRQAIYETGFTKGRDALFEIVDGLIERPHAGCGAEISLSPFFRRRWSSLYKAVEEGEVKPQALTRLFMQQLPTDGVQVYPLDSTVWPHPAAQTLEEMVFSPCPTKALKRHSIVQGHEHSLLGWTARNRESWTPTIMIERIVPSEGAIAVGVRQVKAFCQQRRAQGATALDVVAGDGNYGNHRFFGPLREQPCAIIARLRRDRVLFGPPNVYKGRGRRPKHGQRFAFKEAESWPTPDEETTFTDERWGQVRLRRWNDLHDRQDSETILAVICAEVHREKEKPPAALWLGYKPGHTDYPLRDVWSWFDRRWPIEPSIRFRKQGLFWTLPALQASQDCDRWTWLVQIAFWFLFLARPLLPDLYLPWQKPAEHPTPARVKRAFPAIFATIGTPAKPPQTRGNSPGWPKGKPRKPKERHKPVKRRPAKPKKKLVT